MRIHKTSGSDSERERRTAHSVSNRREERQHMKLIAALLLFSLPIFAQPTQNVVLQADCILPFYFTAPGTQMLPDNTG